MARLVVGSALVNAALLGGLLAVGACSGSEESPASDTAGNAGSQAGDLSSGGASGSGLNSGGASGLSGKSGSGGSAASGGLGAAGTGTGASGAGNAGASGGTRAGEAGGGSSGNGGTADPGSGGTNAGATGGSAGTAGDTAGTGGSDSAGASGTGGANSGGGSGPEALSFEADVWPMFAMIRDPVFVYPGAGSYESCVTTGVCHGGMAPGARLSMPDAATAYGQLLDVPSQSELCDGTIRVVAGEPEQSCLVLFYEGRLREELDWVDAAEIDRVRQWIADGALP